MKERRYSIEAVPMSAVKQVQLKKKEMKWFFFCFTVVRDSLAHRQHKQHDSCRLLSRIPLLQ